MTSRIGEELRATIRTQWPAMLAEVSAGAGIKKMLDARGLNSDNMRAFMAEEPGARDAWQTAREQSADAFMEEALDVARDPFVELAPAEPGQQPVVVRLDPSHARTRIDTLKWAARIRNPRTYSDKQQLDVNVRTVDLTRIISDAQARLAAAQVGRVIDGQVLHAALPQMEDLL